jgi:hypothetical protein
MRLRTMEPAAPTTADVIRTEHKYDRALSIPPMQDRITALADLQVLTAVNYAKALRLILASPNYLRNPMSHVAELLAADSRYLKMSSLTDSFTTYEPVRHTDCHCIAGWTHQLASMWHPLFADNSDYLRMAEDSAPRLFSWEWALISDTLLAASGHTCAAAGIINYHASDDEGRRMVHAMADLERAAKPTLVGAAS